MRWKLAQQGTTLEDARCTLPVRIRELHIVRDATQRMRQEHPRDDAETSRMRVR